MKKIGVISDTHGIVNEKIKDIFKDCEMIIHAGDIGDIEVINTLETIATVKAVRGNIDHGQWAEKFPNTRIEQIQDIKVYVIHDIGTIKDNPKLLGCSVVIYGHSHQYKQEVKEGILYINPGGSGRKRFSLPLSVVILTINKSECIAEEIYLK